MALTSAALTILKPYLKGRVLQLGYQDILPSQEDIKALFDVDIEEQSNHGGWHGVQRPLIETQAFFEALGCASVCVDIVASRGCEVICDLNYPPSIPELETHQYDVVIDGGTLEHCFNVGVGLITVASTVRRGGVIFHGNPVNWINHGFYCMSPTLFFDFYTQNGWEVLEAWVADREGRAQKLKSPTARMVGNAELSNLFVARRQSTSALRFPTQSKYLRNPTLHA